MAPSITQPGTPFFISTSPDNSPICATSLSFGWITTTWPGLAFERKPVQASSV